MYKLILSSTFVFCLFAGSALACSGHGDHDHSKHDHKHHNHSSHDHKHQGHSHKSTDPCKKFATKDVKGSAFTVGKCHIQMLIMVQKIDKSWAKAKELKVKKAKNKKDWQVTFENDTLKKDKVLYIFLDERGGYLAANFKGE